MLALKIMYSVNILVTGWVGINSLFFPKFAHRTLFSDGFEYSRAIRLVGALWLAIFVLSVLGLFFPYKMSLVLLFQLIYKLAWLLFAALPGLIRSRPFPKSMAIVFILYLLALPFIIPWSYIFMQ